MTRPALTAAEGRVLTPGERVVYPWSERFARLYQSISDRCRDNEERQFWRHMSNKARQRVAGRQALAQAAQDDDATTRR